MRIVCPSCASGYEVDASAIGAKGRMVRCASCAAEWFQTPAVEAAAPPRVEPAVSAPSVFDEPATTYEEPAVEAEPIYYDTDDTRAVAVDEVVEETPLRSRRMPEAEDLAESLMDDAPPPRAGGAFLAGFATVTLLALLFVAAYVKAPELAALAPGVEGPLLSFASIVDQGRIALAAATGG